MRPRIHLALVDDWEVRGNGSGDPRILQFAPMRRLTEIYAKHGIRGSFNVEVMQQLTYRDFEGRFPELRAVADEWDRVVQDSFRQGHDMQLHLHPQWTAPEYEGEGRWKLHGDWSIINYSPQQIRDLLVRGKQYLETLLRTVDAAYTCISFRGGSWCAAPSDCLFSILAELGIIFDMSIVAGIRIDTPQIKLDYSRCEEPFLPYYPEMCDARRVSPTEQALICLPTHSFGGARMALLRRDLGKARMAVRKRMERLGNGGRNAHLSRGRADDWTNPGESGIVGLARRMRKRYIQGQTHISDLSRMNYAMMRCMMASIRKQAAESGLEDVPVILENHTKDIHDFSDIERFLDDVARSTDVKTVTLTELANGLRDGTFKVRTR